MPRNSAPPDARAAPRSWPLATATTGASADPLAALLPSLAPEDETPKRHEHAAAAKRAAIRLVGVIPQPSVGTSFTRNITTNPISRNATPTATPTRWLAKNEVRKPITAGPMNAVAVPDIV